jgi:hypothetical protein
MAAHRLAPAMLALPMFVALARAGSAEEGPPDRRRKGGRGEKGDVARLFGTSFARFALPGKVTVILAETSHVGALRQQPARWT